MNSLNGMGSFFESLEPRLMLSSAGTDLDSTDATEQLTASVSEVSQTVGSTDSISPTVADTVTADGDVTGIYVSDSGTLLFAFGDAGVQIVSIADPLAPQVLCNYATTHPVTAVLVVEDTMYVALSSGQLKIVDISDLSDPIARGSYSVGETILSMAYLDSDIDSQSQRLYLACGDAGVAVIDVSTPTDPSLLGGSTRAATDIVTVGDGTDGWSNNAIAVASGNYVYLLNWSDPDNPTTISYKKYSNPTDLCVTDGTKLYITDDTGLHLTSVTSSSSFRNWGTVDASPVAQDSSVVSAYGQVAFFGQTNVGVSIIDTGSADGPTVIGTYSDTDITSVAASGTTLYVADGDETWVVVDTGITRDLTASDANDGEYYIAPGKTFKASILINNLGDLAVLANQKINVTVYLSTDATLDSSDYKLTPVTIVNTAIPAQSSLAKTISLKASSSVPEGFYYLIIKLENGGDADDDLTNDIWTAPSAALQVLKGKPVVAMALDADDDSGTPGDNITKVSSVSFSGTTRANCTVTLKRGGTILGTTTSAADGTFSFTDIILKTGTNSLSVVVTDLAGNSGKLSAKIVLDQTVSASTLALSRASDSGKAGDWLTNLSPVALTGKTEKNSSVVLLVNGSPVATTTASTKGVYSFTGVALADGANDVVIQVTDVAGNVTGTPGNPASLAKTLTLDQAADLPTLALAAESDTGTPGDNITSLSKVRLTGTAEAGSKVYLKILKAGVYVKVASTTAAADGTFSFAKVKLKLGDNTFGVFVTDLAGNLNQTLGLLVQYVAA
jgi:hypothetical protein